MPPAEEFAIRSQGLCRALPRGTRAYEEANFNAVPLGVIEWSAGFLVVGTVRVKTFKLSGVPYCNAHKNAVELKTGTGNKLYLDWRSLAMMRRYLTANRGRFAE